MPFLAKAHSTEAEWTQNSAASFNLGLSESSRQPPEGFRLHLQEGLCQ